MPAPPRLPRLFGGGPLGVVRGQPRVDRRLRGLSRLPRGVQLRSQRVALAAHFSGPRLDSLPLLIGVRALGVVRGQPRTTAVCAA